MPESVPRYQDMGDGITAIDTDLLRPMFDASHLLVENGRAAFLACGVNDSVPLLLATLAPLSLSTSHDVCHCSRFLMCRRLCSS